MQQETARRGDLDQSGPDTRDPCKFLSIVNMPRGIFIFISWLHQFIHSSPCGSLGPSQHLIQALTLPNSVPGASSAAAAALSSPPPPSPLRGRYKSSPDDNGHVQRPREARHGRITKIKGFPRCHIVAFCNQLQLFYSPPESPTVLRFAKQDRNTKGNTRESIGLLWRFVGSLGVSWNVGMDTTGRMGL